jgi:hypothetical protein
MSCYGQPAAYCSRTPCLRTLRQAGGNGGGAGGGGGGGLGLRAEATAMTTATTAATTMTSSKRGRTFGTSVVILRS